MVEERLPVQPDTVTKDQESFSTQPPDEHERRTSEKTPAPVVDTVVSSAAENRQSYDAVTDTESDSDDLWIAPPGKLNLGRFFNSRADRLNRIPRQ